MANDINKDDPHYKGEYGSIYEVNRKFPTGGVAGDFVVIDGWAHYWNADRGTWCVNAERDSYWDELITNIIEKFKLVRGATYMGVASLDTVPAKAIGAKMYYFATVAGTYKNFDNLVVPQGINVLYSENGSSWVNITLLEVAQELGVSTNKVMSQKAVSDKLSELSSSLNDLSSKTIDVFNFTPDCAVNQKGVIVEDNRYCITRKIDVSNLVGKSIIWACGSDKQDLALASLAEYDSSDAFLGYYGMHSTRTITVDENTSYIIATMDKENIDKSYIADVHGNTLWSPFGNKASDDEANKMLKYTPYLKIEDGGGVVNSKDTCITDKIDVSKYKGYDVIVNSQIGKERLTYASFYSDDGSCITSWLNDNKRSISVPSNASYLICTVSLDKVNSCYVMRDENNVLWRPTYDGMTSEQKVDKASIVQKLGEDESKVVSQKCVKSAFDVFNFTPDCAVNQKGVIVEDNRYCITRKIDVSNLVGKSIIWACGSDKQDLALASLAEYDSSDAFLGYYGMHSTRTITVDENTSYIIATMDKENIDKSYIADVHGNTLWSPFGNKASDDGILPSYYNTYITDKLEKINQLSLISSRHCDDFIFITDMHIEVNYMQSPKLIKHIVSRTNLKKLFNGGDVMNGQATREEGRIQLRRWMDLMSFIDQYITLGNHDTNSSWAQTKDGWFSYDEVYNMLYKPLEEKINTNGQLYYCLDNESQKIRYFFLNAQWPEEQTNHEAQLKYNDQLSWLETKCREIGKDWSIVVVQHIFFTNYSQIKNDDGSYTTIKAERATIAGYLASKLKEINSNELMPKVLFVMVGHTHWDWVEFFDGGFPVIATSSDSSYNWEGPGNTAWTKKIGTVEEQCFDVVHADIGKELITSIRIGQGNDRKTHLDIKNMSVGESLTLLTSLEGNVKWRSVYEDIATVDSGVINAKKAGMATIIADNKNGGQEYWGVLVV